MASSDHRREKARQALADEGYVALFATARRRLERNGASLSGTPLRLDAVSSTEREAIAGLLGLPVRAEGPLRVRLDALDAALRQGAAEIGLVELLAEHGGPLRDRPAEQRRSRSDRERVWAEASGHAALGRHPRLVEWLAAIRRSGSATRLGSTAGAEVGDLLGAALDVAARLPADGVALAALAAECAGDAHALDRGRPLGTLLDGALDRLDVDHEVVDDAREDEARGAEAESARAWHWRRRWARVGVLCDDLSVSVLVLNLPVSSGGELVAGTVADHASFGEPLRLTLRQLALAEMTVPAGSLISVCENPSVVAQAASLLEEDAAPLVCLGGNPDSAVVALLDLLARSGARFRYHGDFDWGGLRIANRVMAGWSADPWRMAEADYRSAARKGRLALIGTPVEASWDAGLAPAMSNEGVAVHEEQVLGLLLDDLAGATTWSGTRSSPS